MKIQAEQEVEKLKEELKYTIPIVEHNKTITKHLKEIERLNNIINELEKWLNEEKEATFYDYQFAIEDVLDKLRELKGSGKE